MFEEETNKEFENEGVEIGGDNNANDDGNDAVFFDFVVRGNAVGKILGNLAIEKDGQAAAQNNNEANNEPGNAKRPVYIHKSIIACFMGLSVEVGEQA